MFAGLPPSSSELTERESVVPPFSPQIGGANIAHPRRRRRSHRIARRRAAEE
jgi:hypothetical protein